MPKGIELLEKAFIDWNLPYDIKQLQMFEKYYSLLFEWNQKMNITAIEALDDVMIFHFLDSLTPLLVNKISHSVKVVDVGSGGGFPGVPIKIMRPDLNMVLLDSSKKRISFLNNLIVELGLENIVAIHKRAEEAGSDKNMRESFDVVLSRAVAQLRVLSEYCLPLASIGGTFLAHKGPGVEEEMPLALKAIKELGGDVPKLSRTGIPNSQREHILVIVDKISKTPVKFPRKPGTPEKSPI